MKILTEAQLKAIDEWLQSYADIDKLINKHNFLNNQAIVTNLERFKVACECTLDDLNERNKTIFKLRYKHGKAWDDIEEMLNISKRTSYRQRNKIIQTFADNIGIFI